MIGFGVYIGILLLVGSIYDLRYYSLPVWILVMSGLGGVAGILFALLGEKGSIAEVGLALLPGIGAILLAYVTKEQIGYGDGLLLLSIGGCLGMEQVMTAVTVAMAGACVISILLLVCRKVNRGSRIPFVPFLTLGYIGVVFGGLVTG